jgi:hypothetical protein
LFRLSYLTIDFWLDFFLVGYKTILGSAQRPVRFDFLRRIEYTDAEINAKRGASPRPSTLAAAEVSRLHRGLKPVLRGVSGATVVSLDSALQHTQSGGNPSVVQELTAPPALRPMVCGIMGKLFVFRARNEIMINLISRFLHFSFAQSIWR